MSTGIERATIPDLRTEQCIALTMTTFRKSGQAVTTPVMFAERPGTIYVRTRRLRQAQTPEPKLPCHAPPRVPTAASTLLSKKYGFMLPLTRKAWCLIHRKAKAEDVYIAIEPIAG